MKPEKEVVLAVAPNYFNDYAAKCDLRNDDAIPDSVEEQEPWFVVYGSPFLFVVVVHLDSFEDVSEPNNDGQVATLSNNGCQQCFKIKPVKDVLRIEFFLINIFQRFFEDLLELVEIWLGQLLLLGFVLLATLFIIFCAVKVSYSEFSDLRNKLFFQIVSVIYLALVKVKQEKYEKCNAIALNLQIFNMVNIKENVAMDLSEAEENTKYLEVVVILHVFVGSTSALLAFFETIIIVL